MVSLDDPRIEDYIEELAGEEGMEIARLLKKKGNVVDNDLAEALEWKPSSVRKVLYKLYEGRAAEYVRDRDEETGYEIFIWELNLQDALEAIAVDQRQQVEDLREQLEYEDTHEFYVCEECGNRYLFEEASESDFHCPDDGATLDHDDNEDIVEQLRERVEAMEEELAEIEAKLAEEEE